MTDDLISRLRARATYNGWDTQDIEAGEAADALEAQARRIAELTGNREAWKGIQEGTARLLQEKEARIAELEAQLFAGNDWLNARHAVLQELAEANARIAALEAALKPFADVNLPDDLIFAITFDDLRAARAALKKD